MLVVVDGDVLAEPAEDRVVLQQVRERLVVGEVVDRDDLDVGALRQGGAEEVAADAAEAVDAYADGHGELLLGVVVPTCADDPIQPAEGGRTPSPRQRETASARTA